MSDIAILPTFEYLGGEVPRLKAYGWSKARCILPDHEDRNASASVNEEFAVFNCMVCGVAYDAPGLLMELEGLSFPDAERKAATLAGDGDGVQPAAYAGRPGVPVRTSDRRTGGGWVPPWARGRPGSGA